MSHITSIGAGMFSDMALATPSTPLSASALAALDTAAEFQALFANEINSVGGTKATGTFTRIKNVREFPSMGTPPNIVNVPVYGSKTSQQIQGQADAPSIELTLNYVPAEWAAGSILGDAVGDGNQYVFRFALLNAEPVAYSSETTPADGIGSVANSQYYWVGKIEALQVNPQLTDANTATVTISVQSEFFGAFTE
ncbi:hypothetical protein [Flavobacterium sp.]|jgi:hypothetical protein|uniref:hypothetical protein n=1 Tax=Flavobacterium sp. TaxID=239 RepID=UPI0037BF4D83